MSDLSFEEIQKNGLTDTIYNINMGVTAENIAKKYEFTRQKLDEIAFLSNQRAINSDFSNEIIKVANLDKDENIRYNQSIEKLNSLKPAFIENGLLTAGNSSSLNDGAAILILMSEKFAKDNNYEILGYISNYDSFANDPKYMGLAPIGAVNKLLESSNLSVEDIDIFEINEAFSSQILANAIELNIKSEKLNPKGSSLSLGHPIGCSGARIVVTLIHILMERNKKRGIASMCIGGGQALSLLIERE